MPPQQRAPAAPSASSAWQALAQPLLTVLASGDSDALAALPTASFDAPDAEGGGAPAAWAASVLKNGWHGLAAAVALLSAVAHRTPDHLAAQRLITRPRAPAVAGEHGLGAVLANRQVGPLELLGLAVVDGPPHGRAARAQLGECSRAANQAWR